MNNGLSTTTCPACKHQYYAEDKSTYRVCSKCGASICTICAARDMWTCPLCRNPYATLEQLE